MKKKIGVVSLGCPKNLVDSEIMLGLLNKSQFEIVADENEAQIIVVNTCGFIESAKQESIDTILEMAEYKNNNCELLIVTGCLGERYREEILKEMPEVDAVLGTGNYKEIANIIKKAYQGEKTATYGNLDAIDYLEDERLISTGKGYSYLKIAEGCDNCCSYCIIPTLRGRYRSRKIEDILTEAQRLATNGVKEIILVAQDTTRYGVDLYGEKKIVELIKKLSSISGVEWIRLLYCYPEDIDDNLINEIKDNHKVVKYLDIPLQHFSDRILKKMGRRGNSREITGLIEKLNEQIPGLFLRTSLIVGFPGEKEDDFNKVYEFVKKIKFDRLGVFAYSREEDTPAAEFEEQVNEDLKKERLDKLMVLQKSIAMKKNEARIGATYKTLVEGVAEDGIFYYGRSYAEAPDIDTLIYFTSPYPLNVGEFVNVKILNNDEYDLVGEVIDESCK